MKAEITIDGETIELKEYILKHTFKFFETTIKSGIRSVKYSERSVNLFYLAIDELNEEERLQLEHNLIGVLNNIEWLGIEKDNVHKAWLLVTVFWHILYEINHLITINDVQDQFTKAFEIIKKQNYCLSKLRTSTENLYKESNDYSEYVKNIDFNTPPIIKRPLNIKPDKAITVLKWIKDPNLIKELYLGLINLKAIYQEDVTANIFFQVFSGTVKTNKMIPIPWRRTLRMLVFLMDLLDRNDFLANGNTWPSVIEKAKLFSYNKKPISAKTLSSTKNQIQNLKLKDISGAVQINELINKLNNSKY